MNRVFLISFFLLLTGGICAQQATTGVLTLKEAEQRFLERNLSLIAERYNIDMAQAQVLQAKLFENPVISLEQNVYNRLNGKYFDFCNFRFAREALTVLRAILRSGRSFTIAFKSANDS